MPAIEGDSCLLVVESRQSPRDDSRFLASPHASIANPHGIFVGLWINWRLRLGGWPADQMIRVKSRFSVVSNAPADSVGPGRTVAGAVLDRTASGAGGR